MSPWTIRPWKWGSKGQRDLWFRDQSTRMKNAIDYAEKMVADRIDNALQARQSQLSYLKEYGNLIKDKKDPLKAQITAFENTLVKESDTTRGPNPVTLKDFSRYLRQEANYLRNFMQQFLDQKTRYIDDGERDRVQNIANEFWEQWSDFVEPAIERALIALAEFKESLDSYTLPTKEVARGAHYLTGRGPSGSEEGESEYDRARDALGS